MTPEQQLEALEPNVLRGRIEVPAHVEAGALSEADVTRAGKRALAFDLVGFVLDRDDLFTIGRNKPAPHGNGYLTFEVEAVLISVDDIRTLINAAMAAGEDMARKEQKQ